ncbi:hypothetical protein ACLB2K_004558 [Fragaria x ananassa]
MVPKTVVFKEELPKTSTGKIQKFVLREIAKSIGSSSASTMISRFSHSDNVKFSHIFRECNVIADSLAKTSIDHAPGLFTFENPPVHAIATYLDDLDGIARLRKSANSVVPLCSVPEQ